MAAATFTEPALDADLALLARTHCTCCGSPERDSYEGEKGQWHRCRDCGFWVSSLIVDVQEYAEGYYGMEYQSELYGKALKRKLRTSHYRLNVIEHLLPGRGAILDVGCSWGSVVAAANERGWTGYGVDIAPAIVEVDRQNGLDVRVGSLTELPFDDASCDVIHARHVLEHDIHTHRALAEMTRVLKPGGLLVIEVPDGDCRRVRANPAREAKIWWYVHMVTFTPETLARFCRRHGLGLEPEPERVPGPLGFRLWRAHKLLRERARLASYFVNYWRKPA